MHVHGLGINPADHALFIATHAGLFRSAQRRVGARRGAALLVLALVTLALFLVSRSARARTVRQAD